MNRTDLRRLLLEGAVIVSSILLAFAIDAAWDAHLERRDAADFREEIRHDITNTRLEIARALSRSESIAAGARRILGVMAATPAASERDSVIATLGSVFVQSPWDPVNEADARLALSRYQSQLQFVGDLLQSAKAQYYAQQDPFMVANAVYSDMAMDSWRDDLVAAPFSTDYAGLAENRALWNLLTFRLEREVALHSRLRKLDGLAVEALAALD